jgi:hypothetical protein
MREQGTRKWIVAAALMAALALAACGEKDEPDLASLPPQPTTTTTAGEAPAGEGAEKADERPGTSPAAGTASPPASSPEREATQTVEAYIVWIDNRQGRQLCTLLTDEAIEALKLPVRRGGCAASLTASIGYRDPRGLPVFRGVELRRARARVTRRNARVVASVSTTFADRARPSLEDDIVYLRRVAGDWRVVKPSATLYRAIGIADIPPSVIAPP